MEITSIKPKEKIPLLFDTLSNVLSNKGYTYRLENVNSTHIKISHIRLSEKYVKEHGYNISAFSGRRGRYLSWKNWLEVNDIINNICDLYDISCHVYALKNRITIRYNTTRYHESDWYEFSQENIGSIYAPVYRCENWKSEV